jgi:hypothetical protein
MRVKKKSQEKIDLTTINPTLAGKILSQINRSVAYISPQFASLTKAVAPPAAAPPTQYQRVGEMLNCYKDAVHSKLKDVRDMAIVNLVFIAMTLVFLALAVVSPNLTSLVSSIGLGGTSLIAQATTWKDALITYINDSGKLNRKLLCIEGEYKNCDANDSAAVQKIDDEIIQDFKDLDAAQSGKTQ